MKKFFAGVAVVLTSVFLLFFGGAISDFDVLTLNYKLFTVLLIFAWFGLGIPLMFIANSLRFDEKKFLRFVSAFLRSVFFASWYVYISIQARKDREWAVFEANRDKYDL